MDYKKPVEVLICDTTDLGTRVIVNDMYEGLIYNSDMHKNVRRGQRVPGFVTKVREDGKLDVRLEKPGYGKIEGSVETLLSILEKDGYLPLTDKSDPELIKATLGMSKKSFKQAVGFLYKEKMIKLEKDKIELLKD
jgi:predicted RNA-binding protein (virulence factor B family)